MVWLNLDPQAGHEQSGKRPAVVLSPEIYNKKTGLALFCPVTSQVKGYPFEVPLPAKLPVSGVILVDHIKNMDWRSRSAVFIARLPQNIIGDVLARLRSLIDQ
ncbi:MAG: type II toxin-antitoxin system PemK/MazF family toxin [Mangrovibacterium sp.]